MDISERQAKKLTILPILDIKFIRYYLAGGIGFVIAIVLLLNLTTLRFVVDGSSMSPTFETGHYLLVSRVHYLLDTPQRSDLITFHLTDNPGHDVIKRVIALPGETIEFRDTGVYINGIQLDEPYIAEVCNINFCADAIWQIGLDEYFVLGDNRNESSDSRFFGMINIDDIVGKVIVRYYPFSELDWIR